MKLTSSPEPKNLTGVEKLIRRLTADAQASQQAAAGSLTDGVAPWLAAQYVATSHDELVAAEGPQRRQILQAMIRDWSILRRNDHTALRLQLESKRLEFDQQKHRDAVAAAQPQDRKRPDYLRPLTDEERAAIVDKVDEIMGLK